MIPEFIQENYLVVYFVSLITVIICNVCLIKMKIKYPLILLLLFFILALIPEVNALVALITVWIVVAMFLYDKMMLFFHVIDTEIDGLSFKEIKAKLTERYLLEKSEQQNAKQ